MPKTKPPALTFAPDVAKELTRWLIHLGSERRMSPKTLEAYRRDIGQFLAFMAEHLGSAPSLKVLAKLTPQDVRAFMAARRAAGISGRSLMRVSGRRTLLCAFPRAQRQGQGGGAPAVRAPKVSKTLPKPLAAAAARRMTETDLRAGEERAPWIFARDAAVLALLYGSGLRISEALSLTPRRHSHRRNERRACPVTGKGGRPAWCRCYRRSCADRGLCRALPVQAATDGPLFVGARGGPLSPRILQLTMARLRGALGLPDTATPHALRHSSPRTCLARGGDLRAIQELLGHASLSTTQIYTAVDSERPLEVYRSDASKGLSVVRHPRA